MKELPSEEKLAELVERARIVAQKAQQLDEISEKLCKNGKVVKQKKQHSRRGLAMPNGHLTVGDKSPTRVLTLTDIKN